MRCLITFHTDNEENIFILGKTYHHNYLLVFLKQKLSLRGRCYRNENFTVALLIYFGILNNRLIAVLKPTM